MLKMKDCLAEELSNGLVKITEKKGRFKTTVLKSRISRYIEDYNFKKVPENNDNEKEELKKQCIELSIVLRGNPSVETLKSKIAEKTAELGLEDDDEEEESEEESDSNEE